MSTGPSRPSILLTGPSGRTTPWAAAAGAADWDVHVCELLVIEPCPFAIERDPESVVVASANALPALSRHRERLRGIAFACVGDPVAAELESWGLVRRAPAAPDRAALVDALAGRLRAQERVLAPRGDRSEELARALEKLGATVDAPIAYRVHERAHAEPLPATDAVLFASPSCVAAWSRAPRARPPGRPLAVAMGRSTARALMDGGAMEPASFGPILVLERPEPDALTTLLRAHRP